MEKPNVVPPMHPKAKRNREVFKYLMDQDEQMYAAMLNGGDAYAEEERDEEDKLRSIKIFSNSGELLYFKDFTGTTHEDL